MTGEVIVFPDVEGLLCSYLGAALASRGVDAPVGTAVPNPRPSAFVRVQRTGGPVSPALFCMDAPMVVVEAWATDEVAAATLAALVRGLLHALPGQEDSATPVYRVDELAGPANLPDPNTPGMTRYTLTASLLVRGTAA